MVSNGIWFVMHLSSRRARKTEILQEQCKAVGMEIPIYPCESVEDAPVPLQPFLGHNVTVVVYGDKVISAKSGHHLRDVLLALKPLSKLYVLLPPSDDCDTARKVAGLVYSDPSTLKYESVIIDNVDLSDIVTDERIPQSIRCRVGYLPFIAVVGDNLLTWYGGDNNMKDLSVWLSHPTLPSGETSNPKKWGLTHRSIYTKEQDKWTVTTLSSMYGDDDKLH